MAKRLISLHPKLAAVAEALASAGLLFWFHQQESIGYATLSIFFTVRSLWWLLLTQLTYYPQYISRAKHFFALLFSAVGAVSFLVFSDINTMRYVWLLVVLIPIFTFWVLPEQGEELSMLEKTHRRGKLFLSLFGVAGIWLALYGSIAFQIIDTAQIIYSCIGGAFVTSLVGLWHWREYNAGPWTVDYAVLTALFFLFFGEFSLALLLWPIGYLAMSFFVTWLWYILWLLFRFYLSRDGIDWKHQRGFLVFNALCMFLFLFFTVRWK